LEVDLYRPRLYKLRMLLLSETDVHCLLPMRDLIPAMEQALLQFSSGRVQQPLRTVLQVGDRASFFGVMPAFLPDTEALGTKLVTVFGGNAAIGLPTHLATIVMLDSKTGQLQAVMDGRYITESRTAAVSAVSVKQLALPDAGVLALIGSGVQARSHLEAITQVRKLRDVRVWSPNAERRQRFADEMQAHSPAPITPTATAADAVAGADIVALVSSAREPVVRSEWIADGAHICAVGACRPDQREMDTALVSRARVFVDSRIGALAEAGDIVIPMKEGAFGADHVAGELGELAAGTVIGRQHAKQVTLFKSLGMAVEDVAAAHLALSRAAEKGLGRGAIL
jgi:ornithine cyclodeaminase/alanine dehydrogenase-like protein (mu-crystallin family)